MAVKKAILGGVGLVLLVLLIIAFSPDITESFEEPPFMNAEGVYGYTGYILSKDLHATAASSPEHAVEIMDNPYSKHYLPLYNDSVGTIMIGTFQVGSREGERIPELYDGEWILARGVEGITGHVRLEDINNSAFDLPEEGKAPGQETTYRFVPLYGKDKETVIGEFQVY